MTSKKKLFTSSDLTFCFAIFIDSSACNLSVILAVLRWLTSSSSCKRDISNLCILSLSAFSVSSASCFTLAICNRRVDMDTGYVRGGSNAICKRIVDIAADSEYQEHIFFFFFFLEE